MSREMQGFVMKNKGQEIIVDKQKDCHFHNQAFKKQVAPISGLSRGGRW